jgi:hypothetical protein
MLNIGHKETQTLESGLNKGKFADTHFKPHSKGLRKGKVEERSIHSTIVFHQVDFHVTSL